MKLTRRIALGSVTSAAIARFGHRARARPLTIRIGVLTDLSGPQRSLSGPDGVAAAKLTAAEFMAWTPSIRVEIIAADHQNKPDVGAGILRSWLDQDGVRTMCAASATSTGWRKRNTRIRLSGR